MKKSITLFLLLLTLSSTAQTSQQLVSEAIQLMDKGLFPASRAKLDQAKNIDPKNLEIDYEIAYWYFLQEMYDDAIQILTHISKKKDATHQYTQMLGVCYSTKGENEKAIAVFDKGIKKYPQKGIMYLERSIMEMKAQRYNQAVEFLEKGIVAEPMFPSNYYRLAQIYLNSENEIWGMLYGELFMNLEKSTTRTNLVSKWLYMTYKDEIIFQQDSILISFSKLNVQITSSDQEMVNLLTKALKQPFVVDYEDLLLAGAKEVDSISIANLHHIRTKFIELYVAQELHTKYKNVLFDYQKQLYDADLFEPYNYWLLQMGHEEEFTAWKTQNEALWERFVIWFTQHPIQIDKSNYFLRIKSNF